MATREEVMAALLSRLEDKVPNLALTGRAYVDPNTLQPEQQPALLVVADQYLNSNERGRPPVKTIHAVVILYARALEADGSPETPLNVLIDAVEAALERQPNEPLPDLTNPTSTNLGGLCSRLYVTDVDVIPGDLGGQGAAMVSVEILL
jgi:hypothetical protein